MAQSSVFRGTARKIVERDGRKYFYYHNTPVVVVSDDSICLNTGGFMTATTKLAMNQASNQDCLGFQVYQKNYIWYIDYKGVTFIMNDETFAMHR